MTRLLNSLSTTEALAELFSDHSILQAMLKFEAALARIEANHKIIPHSAAKVIADSAEPDGFDIAAMVQETRLSATLGVPLVKALTKRVRDKNPVAAGFVHWGATSQDVCDTALVLLLKQCRHILQADHERILAALRRLSND